MKGSVQLKNGYWYTVINYSDIDGTYKRKWENTGLKERGNKKEANRILEERIQAFEEEHKLRDDKIKNRMKPAPEILERKFMNFVDYCAEYVESIKHKLSPYVYNQYSSHYIKVFREYFKKLRLIDITNEEIDGFNEHLKAKGLSNTTLRHYSDVLRPSLRKAFIDKIIPDNPYDKVRRLIKNKPKVGYYNKDELNKLFEVTKGHKLDLAIKMLAYYGLRRSELLGLKWQAIDFEHNTISVNHKIIKVKNVVHNTDELKTTSSNRTMLLFPNLKQDLLERKQKIEENKKFFGNGYNTYWNDYIFVDEQGTILQPDYVTHGFLKIIRKHKLKEIRLHDLRHSCASLLLANGISMKQIQEYLGHADFSTTANTYSHLDFSTKVQSANTIYNALVTAKKEDKVAPENNSVSSLEFLSNIHQDMQENGFNSLDDYFNFLQNERIKYFADRESNDKSYKSRSKSDFEM